MRPSDTLGTIGARSSIDDGPRVLAPPQGTRDVLPLEATARRGLSRAIAELLELHGYGLVITPPFERAESIELGLGADPRETLRFVDPETGDVCVFRPDLTVQVARIVASGLRDRRPPLRLYYDGHVVRARRGRARRQRQIAQIGAECLGVPGARGDAEIIALASRALSRVGLVHRIEIAVVPMVRALCDRLPETLRDVVAEALARKDRLGVERALATRDVDGALVRAVVELEGLTGGLEVLDRAKAQLGQLGQPHLGALDELCRALDARGLGAEVRLDLGEVRGLDYYTGPSFALLADGPGEPLGGGGRYDDLLGRFGRPLPASGFAVDLDHLARAIDAQGHGGQRSRALRVCVTGADEPTLETLRGAGVAVTALGDGTSLEDATAYAAEWDLAAAVMIDRGSATLQWIGASQERCPGDELAQRLTSARARTEERT